MFRADLHCHSTCSDGTVSPQDLVRLAKTVGLSALAITDHDTIDAYLLAEPVAREVGIILGTGVEFSCDYKGKSVHVLGYGFPYNDPQIHNLCMRHQERRKNRNRAILDKLQRLGFALQEKEISQDGVPVGSMGRPHIAHALVKRGIVHSMKEAFNLYLGEGKCCYERGEPFGIPETLDILHAAGAKVFLAHPHLGEGLCKVKELLEMPFDGIECYYARCYPEQEKRWLKLAKDRGLLISGGSDFHGDFKPYITLGCSWVDEETFHQIFPNL